MVVTIDLFLIVNNTKTALGGNFHVKNVSEVPKVALDWIRKVRRDTGYYGKDSIIEKVVWNGVNDITDKVREIDEVTVPDLPFLW